MYDGPYQDVDFIFPVICKIRHTRSKKERTVHVSELKQQHNEQDYARRKGRLRGRHKDTGNDKESTRKETGFSIGHLLESSVITPGGKDTYEDDKRIRVTIRDPPAGQQD